MTHPAAPSRSLAPRAILWTARLTTLAWAGFWAWFVALVGIKDIREGLDGTPIAMAAWFAALAALSFTVWRWPLVGGLLFIAAGLGSAFYFTHPGAQALLALPAVAIGALSLTAAYAGRMPR